MFEFAVIYAGGRGERMLPLTEYIPKGLVRLNNKPLIEHAINFLRKNKVKYIYVTYSYKSEQLLVYLKDKVDGFINTTNQDNAFFLKNSIVKNIDTPIVCMPCDIIADINLKQVYAQYLKLGEPIHSIIPVKPQENIQGDYICSCNNIVTKMNRNKKTNLYASGIQIINPKRVNALLTAPAHNFREVWKQCIHKKQLHLINILPKKWKAYDTLTSIL